MDEAHRRKYEISEETARKMGYPSAQVFVMERKLAELADQWRTTKSEDALTEYHSLYYKMIVFGMNPDAFSPETEIDPAYMPELPERIRG